MTEIVIAGYAYDTEKAYCNGCSVELTEENTDSEMEAAGFDFCVSCGPKHRDWPQDTPA